MKVEIWCSSTEATPTKKRKVCEMEAGSFFAQQEKLWKQRKFTDAEVVVHPGGSRDVVRFPVHRSTLCAASPVFDAAFSSSMQEGATATCSVRDFEPDAVEALLRYMYTGTPCSDDEALEPSALLELAIYYQLGGLAVALAEEILLGVTVDNVRERALVLKRHARDAALPGVWGKFLKMLKKDLALMEAAI